MIPNSNAPSLVARSTRRRRLAPLLLSAALAAALLGTDVIGTTPSEVSAATPLPIHAAIPSAPGPCVAGWREMPVPDRAFISTGFEAVTRNGKPAWILGGSNDGVLALKWTGSWWKSTATGTSGHRGINGGVPVTSTKVLTVGYSRPNGGALTPISGRVVGNKWSGRGVPDPPGPAATLTDVAHVPGGKAWAVGTRLEKGRSRAYALRWTGTKWVRKDPYSAGGAGLMGVDRAPSGAVWIAGWKEISRGRPRPYVAKRTSKGWKGSRGASLPAGSAAYTDIAFPAGNNGWAVGYHIPSGSSRHGAFLHHWDGAAWTAVEMPWADEFSAIPRSIAVGADDEIWIGGAQMANNNREARGFVAHRKDGIWEVSVLGVPKDIHSEVMDVGITDDGAIAAAAVGSSLLVMRTCVEEGVAAASNSRRISVSNIDARRDATLSEPGHGRAPIATRAGADSLATTATTTADVQLALAAPKAPKGYVLRDMAAAAGLASTTRTYDGFAADLDGNGWKDVFYSRHGGVLPRIAMGNAGGFTNAPLGAFTTIDRHGCGRSDVNNDGTIDILCAVGAARGKQLMRHELSLSVVKPDRRVARGSLGINDPVGRGRRVGFIRLDKDPYPEVFITNSSERNDGLPAYNRFYRNNNGSFVSAPGVGLDTSQGGSCIVVGDFDKDGDQDLVYCTQTPISGNAGIRFMRNEGGKLRDRTGARGIRPIGDIDVAFGDVTGDGRNDLIQLSPSRLRVSKWTSAGYRKIYETKVTHAWAVAVGDASGDGRADIYIVRDSNRKNLPDRLLQSQNGGKAFRSVKIPQTTQGDGDDVIALDYDKNGLMDFVVLNGRQKAGPVQLLASFRR